MGDAEVETSVTDGALAALINPAVPAPLAQLRSSSLTMYVSRKRAKGSSADEDGSRVVRLRGPDSAVTIAKVVLEGCESQAKAERERKEQVATRRLTPEDARYLYYNRFYEQAGLPYIQPAPLFQDRVEAEAARYKLWASYYATPDGGLDSHQAACNASAAAAAAAVAVPAIGSGTTAASTTAAGTAIESMDSAQPLPPGWVEHRDSATGQSYYCHAATAVTQWERPQQ